MASKGETQTGPFVDIFGEDEAEEAFLLSKPVCMIVFGKPGIGKTTLAQKISQSWKCKCIEALQVIEDNMAGNAESGRTLQDLLVKGHEIPEELVAKMLLEKMNSPEVAHLGYVLSAFPVLSEECMTIPEQVEIIKNLKLKPDIIINIKSSDYDLGQRLSGQRQHAITGDIYQRDQWDLDFLEKHRKKKRESAKEAGEEETEEEEEEEEAAAEMQTMAELLPHLIQRPEDFLENIEANIKLYRETMLRHLEELMADHNSQFLIELDGNKPVEELFTAVISQLRSLGLRNGALITRLQSSTEEDLSESLENDELFRALSAYKLVAPRYRWRRSRWGRACPVALKAGNIRLGLPELAVSFLGKMYLLSSEDALEAFSRNPRPYLLPPMPLPPCKVLVCGPPSSGKTSLCDLIASRYKGKVLDLAKLIEPRLKMAQDDFIEQVRSDATEQAIRRVKDQVEIEASLKKQASLDIGKSSKENDAVEDNPEEEKDLTENASEARTARSRRDAEAAAPEIQVTAEHPEVRSAVEAALKFVMNSPTVLSADSQAAVLEEVLKELSKENKERFPGAPEFGGWVLDNCPLSRDQWMAFSEKGILPDVVVCLQDSENQGRFLLRRLYLERKDEINSKVLQRLTDEHLRKKQEDEATRKQVQEMLRLQEEKQKTLEAIEEKPEEYEETKDPLNPEEHQIQPPSSKASKVEVEAEPEAEIALPDFPDDGYPEVAEMEPLREKMAAFANEWQQFEVAVAEFPHVQTLNLEIAGKTPRDLLRSVADAMEKPLKYGGWEVAGEDLDEETDDLLAEAEAEEDVEEEEEREDGDEDDEEKLKEKRRHLGDSGHFCPVSLREDFILHPGIPDCGAKYREKTYYFANPEAREKFLEDPEEYVAHGEPLKCPPLRLCFLGPHGAGKTVGGRWLAEKLGLFHIQFEECLQERVMPKTGKRVGPEFDEEAEEDQATAQELEDIASQANFKIDDKNKPKEVQEFILTDEEEAIRANLTYNEPLPPEALDPVVSEWWHAEPIRSTGFILDGFPRTSEEVRFLAERGLCPDAAVILQVQEGDVSARLLPPSLQKWKEKRMRKAERAQRIKDLKAQIRDDLISKRRAELVAEQERKRKPEGLVKEEEEVSEEEPEEEEETSIEAVLEEEFPREEEDASEEEEEQEAEAIDRLKNEIGDKFDVDSNNLLGVQEELEKLLIPQITISGGRKPHIVRYLLYSKLKHLVENRESMFEKCYPISRQLAEKMLSLTYKFPSSFGQWDPVKLREGDAIKPLQNPQNPGHPVVHRQYIYFLSSKENKEEFMRNPIKYIRQPRPKPAVPVRIGIVGPPKSGKTTVAKRFASTYGFTRLSIGGATRLILSARPDSELALMLNWHLHKGLAVPDVLAVQCLEEALLENVCRTVGIVIDGYPVTKQQMEVLETKGIIPIKIFELRVPTKEIFKRSLLQKKSAASTPLPLHDSSQILSVKSASYQKSIPAIRTYYREHHQNWCVIDASRSKWWIWNEVLKNVQTVTKHVQLYLERIRAGRAAGIDKLCVAPHELLSRLGEFAQYCPVNLAEKGELVDCSVSPSLEFAAEFRGHYYRMASRDDLDRFLKSPESYVPPLAPHALPPPEMLPKRLTVAQVKATFPQNAEMQAYCPVTYLDGKQRYEALVLGSVEYAVEYQKHIYVCESEEKLQRFLRLPKKYCDQELPHKLPPIKEPLLLRSLPLPGYLEQGVASSLIKALNEVGCLKPKLPFHGVGKSALLFVAFHLKAHNPGGSEYSRTKYKKKLRQFVEWSRLITYLGTQMSLKYKEPHCRPIDFDHKLRTFFSLRNADLVSG
ncbi:adenylate kinase 9 [Tachyglossus aculeatus]|uniref:adenylate kinase 9 n=1 Tax=Tachyglossus aculeatus TaxID=9261 RepID=UPI0018F2FD20|nr:adenylate kinase 9 [Tachyglossus aculeatus]